MSFAAKRCIVTAAGSVLFPGIDYEGRKPTVHLRTRDVLVVKIPGGSGWNGRWSPRAYSPAMFAVYRLTGKPVAHVRYLGDVGEELRIEQVVEFDIKRKKGL